MKFIIPLPEKITLNAFYSSKHWAIRAKVAELYHQAVFYAVRGKQGYKTTKLKYPLSISYTFYIKGRLPDVDNLPVKLINDGLRKAGVIENDDPKHIKEISVRVEKGEEDYVGVVI